MPLSFMILIGLLISIVGAILFFRSSYRKIAIGLIVVGIVLAAGTVTVIILAVNSSM